MPQY